MRFELTRGFPDCLRPWRGTEISSAELTDVFGNQSNPLSAYLRGMVLQQVSSSYRVGQYSKVWSLNKAGRDELARLVQVANNGVVPGALQPMSYVMQKYGEELHTLEFKYNDSSNRLFHGLQNIKREHKADFWHSVGLRWNYDIVAAAPTILFQLAQKHLGGAQASSNLIDILFGTLKEYLADRTAFRAHVAALTGLTLHDAKRLVNSLFNGARLARTAQCSAYQVMNFDYDAMSRLQADPKVQTLRDDIARMWRKIEEARRFAMPLDGRAGAWKLSKSKDKWSVYFEHERAVLESIKRYLAKTGNKAFTEHDGFRTSREVDVNELETWIEQETGFKLKIEKEEESGEKVGNARNTHE